MTRREKSEYRSADPVERRSSRLRLALKTVVRSSKQAFLDLDATEPALSGLATDILQKEVECARLFNFELPEDTVVAVKLLENIVSSFTQTRKNLILFFDETVGTYVCLNDEMNPGQKPRELTQISDGFLQSLLGSDDVLHTYLFVDDALVGIVAVADRNDGKPFGTVDEVILELMAQYLSTKVRAFQNLKQSLLLSLVQRTTLEVSSKLITAVDQEGVLAATLEIFAQELGFGVCQYIDVNQDTGEGEVLMETVSGQLSSYFHAGLKAKRSTIQAFSAMLSLFTSVARSKPYLHIPGNALGDKALVDVFKLDMPATSLCSVLILPVKDPVTGKIRGTFNLYRTEVQYIGSETLAVAQETVDLVGLAFSRARVLELALAMASTDELTGLTNRRGLYERFESEIERARRHSTSLCVAMLDVDHFKKLNDVYGHLNGDAALRGLAEIFRKNTRKSDIVSRFGGEEFAIVLPETKIEDAEELLERIRLAVAETSIEGLDNVALETTISVGLTRVSVDDSKTLPAIISDALAIADEQLYRAKETGRNQVVVNY